jgi:hypothetical protein
MRISRRVGEHSLLVVGRGCWPAQIESGGSKEAANGSCIPGSRYGPAYGTDACARSDMTTLPGHHRLLRGSEDAIGQRLRARHRYPACAVSNRIADLGTASRVCTHSRHGRVKVRDGCRASPAAHPHVLLAGDDLAGSVAYDDMADGQVRWGGAVASWWRRIWWRQIARTLLGAIAFIALVVVTLGGPARAPGLSGTIEIRWIAVSVAIAASIILLRIGRLSKADPPKSEIIGPKEPQSPTIADITRGVQQASRKYKTEVLYLFNRILQDPSQYLKRINERVEAREGCLCLDVVIDYAFNDATTGMVSGVNESTILLPLIKLKKRVMLDNLEITDGDGRHVAALLQEEVNGLLASVINNLFRIAFLSKSPSDVGRKLTEGEERLRWSLVNLACHADRVDPSTKKAILSLLDAKPSSVADLESLESLRAFCDFCAEHYLIVVEAELPRGSRLSMRYSRTVPEYGRAAGWNDRVRVRLGLSPYRYSIPLRLPFDAPSYHFSMQGVPGQYLAHEALINTKTGAQIDPATFSAVAPQPSLQGRHGSGLPYVHLYTTGLDKASPIGMSTQVEFDEIPPGALGGACVVSAACAVLIWFFALTQPGLRQALASPSDLPALLLAVPAFAATWIGQSVDRILRSSSSAYVGLAISAVLSIASALLYVANSGGRSFYTIKNVTLLHGLVSLKDVDMSWFILAFIASVVTAYLAEMLRDKVRSYMRAVKNGSQAD